MRAYEFITDPQDEVEEALIKYTKLSTDVAALQRINSDNVNTPPDIDKEPPRTAGSLVE